ncbi:thymidine phosphorylase [Corynebacterium diphtheriae]|uniref:Pyrimidine-nucleoside phosphorylase n=1 Tax=Corynebacterium diphtheriae bv. gravis TaxID=1720349 RepID=A0AAX0IYI5_CORDP|nr:thymidine phosphorylase [Corynebacterium diphtheriae]AEX68127.1 Thymidine phosphorylase [Corynebacterium diphtheriae C7 (beta)]AWR16683.1 Thymidine phosphorylase [Corynebacterium diphtheriae]MBG9312886.1 thymidine phosphorylase [Corynebacterium diphtheriae bv. mitis]OFI52126.1 thymidine phosphorylase [Corynebacterium diphtheriae]OKY20875.1 pyrimidine-nucleoside phosphorylase [Corynebacterium diphtheriae bv. gravis]
MAEQFDAVDIIRTKRDGGELTTEQINWVIDAYTRGAIGDEQMAALNMAIFIRDMNRREIVDWTKAMINSGQTMDFSALGKKTTDKHSTGGVGDKLSLPLGPLVASYGLAVPMLSGRGLGHTGGTLDKLEAIPGFEVDINNDRMMNILKDAGVVIASAGSGLAPADKKIYALRDITSTVDCVPLIASSIMSKKIAAGADSLILDVKVGSGAFMKDLDHARELARTMVDLGNDAGVHTRALLTDMSTPLGKKIGNSLEIEETVEVLAGGGPEDVVKLTCELARNMLEMAGIHDADVEERLKDGRAMDVWKRMVRAQGGDPEAPMARAEHTHEVVADRDGYLMELDALALGVGSWRLGAGRARKEDPVQLTAGIEIHADLGQKVVKGQKLLTLHTETPDKFDRALESITPGIVIGDEQPAERQIILDRIV